MSCRVSLWLEGPIRYDQIFTMKSDAIAFGVAGVVFGLIAGWIIGSQQAGSRGAVPAPPTTAAAPATAPTAPPPPLLDESKVTAFKTIADHEPTNPKPRV